MKFNHAYYNSMDRGYYIPPAHAAEADFAVEPEPKEAITELGATEIGFGSNPFQHPIQAVNARIKQGVGYIDIPFFGAGKGTKERFTPESISKKERRDIRELAAVNEVKLSTHASTNIQGLAGFGREGFDEHMREETLKEIKKAIDFSADLQGGAIVFHTGEWPRPFSEQKWNRDKMFIQYPEEENMAVMHMVDKRSGHVIGQVRKSDVVYEPEFKVHKGKDKVDENNHAVKEGDFVDIKSNYLDPSDTEQMFRRVPIWDPDKNNFKTRRLDWNEFEKRSKEKNTTPEYEYYRTQLQEQILRAKGTALYYAQNYEELRNDYDLISKAVEFYNKLEENIPEDEKWKIMEQAVGYTHYMNRVGKYVERRNALPSELLQDSLKEINRQLTYMHEASAAGDVQAMTAAENLQHIKPIYDYGLDKSADTVARAAEFAWQNTNKKKLERPIYVSPESYLPSLYGSHPDEITELIDKSREAMVKRLQKVHNMSEDEAKQVASTHIKGTLDVGHFNLWRQHFKPEEGETPEQTEKRFNKWYLGEVKNLVTSGKIGQIHITDNMGFDDEHLTPGEGTVPMKEILKIVEESGVKDIVVEAGSFNPVDIVPDTFKYFGSPVYNIARGPSFTQFHQTQFGYDAPPFYIVGAYAPSNEWKLWSEVQFE